MANDYKQDAGKVPLLAALQPFAPALYALARMMEDMKHKHQLAGSADPFNQWAQLPAAKARMVQALERHLLPEEEGATLWSVNTKDGSHLHATHGLFNLLGALALHIRDNADRCCGAPDAMEWAAKAAESTAGPCHVLTGMPSRGERGFSTDGGKTFQHAAGPAPIHGPAGADWREPVARGRCDGAIAQEGRMRWCVSPLMHTGPCWDGEVTW